MNGSATTLAGSAGVDQILIGGTAPAAAPSPVELISSTPAELESARLREITKRLAEDVRPLVQRLSALPDAARPLVERARPWADVFLPIAEEMGPRIDDLRPVMRDLRALLSELLVRAGAAFALFAARRDLDSVGGVSRVLGTGARRLASLRPTLPTAGLGMSAPRAIGAPRVGSIARRLRPGRWAFRTVAVGMIVFVLSDPVLRDAMVEEVNWTRSVVQTIEIPTIQSPTFELPNIELPTIELPNIQMPNIEIPTFAFPKQEPAASPKLAPAQFELPPLNAYRAAFETQASYPTVPANATVEWVVALRNTGSAGWYRGVAGAQASLALTDGTEAAVQTTAYVAPGQVGWFIVRFRAPAGPGAHAVSLFPRIDGRGELPNLGIYALVTVR